MPLVGSHFFFCSSEAFLRFDSEHGFCASTSFSFCFASVLVVSDSHLNDLGAGCDELHPAMRTSNKRDSADCFILSPRYSVESCGSHTQAKAGRWSDRS